MKVKWFMHGNCTLCDTSFTCNSLITQRVLVIVIIIASPLKANDKQTIKTKLIFFLIRISHSLSLNACREGQTAECCNVRIFMSLCAHTHTNTRVIGHIPVSVCIPATLERESDCVCVYSTGVSVCNDPSAQGLVCHLQNRWRSVKPQSWNSQAILRNNRKNQTFSHETLMTETSV